jgi:hypothetical protein
MAPAAAAAIASPGNFVSEGKQSRWNPKAHAPGRFEVERKRIRSWLLERQVGRLCAQCSYWEMVSTPSR